MPVLRPLAFALLLASATAACQNEAGSSAYTASADASSASPEAASGGAASAPVDTAARRITTGEATVEVAHVDRARTALVAAVARSGGYVGEESSWNSESSRSARLVLRLPAARAAAFDTVLAGLGRVTQRSSQVDDVTGSYVDVAARLRARRAVEARYVELLAQARTIEDVMTVEAKIAAVREEIESAEGQLRLWDRQIAYSTLTVTLSETGASPGGHLGTRIVDALTDGGRILEGLALALLRLWPFAVLIPLGVWAWRRRRRPVSAEAPSASTDGDIV